MLRAERRPSYSVVVWLYVGLIVGAATLLGWWILRRWGLPTWRDVAFFWAVHALIVLLGRVEVPVRGLGLIEDDRPKGIGLSPGFIVLVTAACATRPSTAWAVAFVPTIPELVKAERRQALKLIFNSGQEAIYVGAASMVFWSAKGLIGGVLGAFGAAAAAALVAVVLNHLLVGVIVALEQGVGMREVVRHMAWPAPLSLGFGLIALLIATLYTEFGPAAALFLFMPLTALRVVREAKLSLNAAVERTVTDFARAVDEKDPYTYRHSDRVATIVVELHRELGTRSKDFERRWSAAVLHDVGKVAVPARILTKSGPLTDSEYEAIKRHPGLGAEAVEEIDLFRDLAPEIRHHHERLDGRGYPDGLAGDSIPFAARVLAVADAFEALTSDRPYRRALTTAEALEELSRSAGAHHDAVVVSALYRVIARGVTFVRPERDAAVRPATRPSLRVVKTA